MNSKLHTLLRNELFFLLCIFLIASFMRLYRISEYMRFLGDEGRDVLVAKGILEGNLTLLGPTSSVGGFFLGPIYYYFMAPFLWLSQYDPVGPAIMIALFGIATVFLLYYITREFFGRKAAVIASFFYAIAPVINDYSRSSWNPNSVPFFALLTLYVLYKALQKNKKWLFVVSGVLFGIMMQLHYIVIFFGVSIAVMIAAYTYLTDKKVSVINTIYIVKRYGLFIIGFIIGWSPFLAFELRHDFINLRLMYSFVFASNETGAGGQSIMNLWYVLLDIFGGLLIHLPPTQLHTNLSSPAFYMHYIIASILTVIGLTFLIRSFWSTYKNKKPINRWYLMLLIWLVVGILPFAVYKKQIYIYYLVFLFPLPFMLLGNFLSKKNIEIASLVIIVMTVVNIRGSIFWYTPNDQLGQTKRIASAVLDHAEGKPFNFALITGGNSDHAYRYFFKLWGNTPVIIENSAVDPNRTTVTDQLLVVCESLPCYPLGNPLWEIAGFGRTKITGQWYVRPYEVYRLTAYTEK